MVNTITGQTPPASAPAQKDDPKKIEDAARQFEALLIGQMLKAMHDSDEGWLGDGSDESSSCAMEYGQEIFGQSLAASGGLGLASLIAAGLSKPGGR